jgi:putative oxidoreductase
VNWFQIVRGLLAVVFFAAGANKLIQLDAAIENFAGMGLSSELVYLVGIGEIACAVGLFVPALFSASVIGMLVFMIGAIGAEIGVGAIPFPALITGGFVLVLWRLRPPA